MFAKALRLTRPLAALLLTAPALAQPDGEALLLGGLGAGAERSPYRGVGTRALPLLVYENDWLSVALATADVKLPSAGPVSLRLRARFSFEGYEAGDSAFLAGMAERQGSLWLGPAAVWESPLGELSAEVSGDSLGRSRGRQWQLQFERRFELGDLAVTPRLGVRAVDRQYVDYYYGVRASEATAARPAYLGASARQAEAGVRLAYAPSERQLLIADVSATRLGRAVERSPLLDRRYRTGLFAGWLYRF